MLVFLKRLDGETGSHWRNLFILFSVCLLIVNSVWLNVLMGERTIALVHSAAMMAPFVLVELYYKLCT